MSSKLISRRRLLASGFGVASSALLAACSWVDENQDADPMSTPSRSAGVMPTETQAPTLDFATEQQDLTPTATATEVPVWDDQVSLTARGYFPEIRRSEDGRKHLVPLEHVTWGGVAKDGIPSIDRPHYVGPDRWSDMVYDNERLVIGVEVNGRRRAYPLQILIWHEIVNETFDGKHLLVTY